MTMLREAGSKNSPIWLLGDSNPKNWADALETPLDSRHPARHSIWTPIMEEVQDRVYRHSRLRVDTSCLFIRNAIEDPIFKPAGSEITWQEPVLTEITSYRRMVDRYHPSLIFCFGAFSYEFARRVMNEAPEYVYSHWGAVNLGLDFRNRVSSFEPDRTNIFPLLHATIARGRFIQSHNYFCNQEGGNYFEFVGSNIANLLLVHKERLTIWIE